MTGWLTACLTGWMPDWLTGWWCYWNSCRGSVGICFWRWRCSWIQHILQGILFRHGLTLSMSEWWVRGEWGVSERWVRGEWEVSERWVRGEWEVSEEWVRGKWEVSERWVSDETEHRFAIGIYRYIDLQVFKQKNEMTHGSFRPNLILAQY